MREGLYDADVMNWDSQLGEFLLGPRAACLFIPVQRIMSQVVTATRNWESFCWVLAQHVCLFILVRRRMSEVSQLGKLLFSVHVASYLYQ